METRDFYVILGAPQDATLSGIREAYRRLALARRPELQGARSMRPFQDVIDAYQVLSDPDRRASYDETRGIETAGTAEPPPQPEPLVPGPLSLKRDFEAREPPVEQVLERILRNFTRRDVPKSEALDALNLTIGMSPEQAATGGVLALQVPVFYPCPVCRGEGHDGLYACLACGQTGIIEDEEAVNLRVPPGARDGDAYDVPLQGLGIENLWLHVQLRVSA